ncbi:hypothetical protein FHS18_000021 [Paenibacillus phyllosphaerae]|uniref:Beta-galactosidase n=1 Tax=Paenibacillus phyllosphaerae TaxID=274593 RepID=A0A7W5ASS7_9BACL|nr:hypothetical protein [Paenibacillus phyllosphaerae]
MENDAFAFSRLMALINSIDADQHTVIVMQVENEIGLLGTDRDYSEVANEAFAQDEAKNAPLEHR